MTSALELLPKATVAQRLHVCERTLENLVRGGKFPPPVRLGKCALWVPAVVDKWLVRKLAPQLNWEPPQAPRRAAAAPSHRPG